MVAYSGSGSGNTNALDHFAKRVKPKELQKLGVRNKSGRSYATVEGAVVQCEHRNSALLLTIQTRDGFSIKVTSARFDPALLGVVRTNLVAIHRGPDFGNGVTWRHQHLIRSWNMNVDPIVLAGPACRRFEVAPWRSRRRSRLAVHNHTNWSADEMGSCSFKRIRTNLPVDVILDIFED